MEISPKPKTFSQFFIASMKSTLNSEYFEKKDQSHLLRSEGNHFYTAIPLI